MHCYTGHYNNNYYNDGPWELSTDNHNETPLCNNGRNVISQTLPKFIRIQSIPPLSPSTELANTFPFGKIDASKFAQWKGYFKIILTSGDIETTYITSINNLDDKFLLIADGTSTFGPSSARQFTYFTSTEPISHSRYACSTIQDTNLIINLSNISTNNLIGSDTGLAVAGFSDNQNIQLRFKDKFVDVPLSKDKTSYKKNLELNAYILMEQDPDIETNNLEGTNSGQCQPCIPRVKPTKTPCRLGKLSDEGIITGVELIVEYFYIGFCNKITLNIRSITFNLNISYH